MSSFVYDNTTDLGLLPYPKADQTTIPAGAQTGSYVSSNDWNVVNTALRDVRDAITSGTYFGFGARTSSGSIPSTRGGSNQDFLWVRSDGVLMQRKAVTNGAAPADFAIQTVANASVATILSEQDSANLASASSGSLILYCRSNGLSQPNRRTQLVVRWWNDQSETVIAEGPAF